MFLKQRYNLESVFLSLEQVSKAIDCFQIAIKLNPEYTQAHYNLAIALQKNEKYEDAITTYQQALALKPDYFEAHYNLGQTLVSLGKLEEAVSNYITALKLTSPEKAFLPPLSFLGQPTSHYWMMATIASLQQMDRPIKLLEVGSWLGSSLMTWDQSITAFNSKGGQILCIDRWKPYMKPEELANNQDKFRNMISDKGIAYNIFIHNENASICEVNHLRGFSNKILPVLENNSFDVVYIDGSHYYDDVFQDIFIGCRLVTDGGYICGDDLELQWANANKTHTELNKNKVDFLQDPEGRYYHPGVTSAVNEVLGDVTCIEGYWIMQMQKNIFKKVKFKKFDHFIPTHFPTEWSDEFKAYVETLR